MHLFYHFIPICATHYNYQIYHDFITKSPLECFISLHSLVAFLVGYEVLKFHLGFHMIITEFVIILVVVSSSGN